MSSEDLAAYLRVKIGETRLSNTKIAQLAGISRRTWYRLLNADIEEARLSTLIKLANVLDTSAITLLEVYYNGKPFSQVKPFKAVSGNTEKVLHSGVPDNGIVNVGEYFVKTWEVVNLQGDEAWKKLSLCCIDDELEVRVRSGRDGVLYGYNKLVAQDTCIDVPFIPMGGKATISIKFKAPEKPCTTVSHWRFKQNGQLVKEGVFPNLQCLVRVVGFQ